MLVREFIIFTALEIQPVALVFAQGVILGCWRFFILSPCWEVETIGLQVGVSIQVLSVRNSSTVRMTDVHVESNVIISGQIKFILTSFWCVEPSIERMSGFIIVNVLDGLKRRF